MLVYHGSKMFTIYEGTNEVQKLVILNSILGKYKNVFNMKFISLREKRNKDVCKTFKIDEAKKIDYFPKDDIVTDFLVSEYIKKSIVNIINN
ncbi:hypothetical protein ACYUJ6_08925 [Clostridium sp. JNZ X4-2]